MGNFSLSITAWYRLNHRHLMWRETKNAYKIWLSEIILQQTRVEQGKAYYQKIVERFPTLQELAAAEEQEVLKLWQGLGYYSRARNLHAAAKQVVDQFAGEFPCDYIDIKSLKGIGDYTAAAIASFAFDLPYPAVDGNVLRVLSRYFNDATPIDTGKGKKLFTHYAEMLIDRKQPALFNQAIMELGAMVCKPKNPDCIICPLQETCEAHREGTQHTLPVKSKKTKVRARYFHFLVFPACQLQLIKRTEKDIWQNMYQLPLIETTKTLTHEKIKQMIEKEQNVTLIRKISSTVHILSHQHIHATFWEVDQPIQSKNNVLVAIDELTHFPLPRLIDRFIEENINLFS